MPFDTGRTLRSLASGALLALVAAPDAGAAVPLEVYGRLPNLEHITLSPDGTRVAFVRTDGDERVLAIMALATGQLVAKVHVGDEKLHLIEWADDAHVMIETSVTDVLHGSNFAGSNLHEWFRMQVYDLTSGKRFLIPPANANRDLSILNVIGWWSAVRRVKDRTVIFVTALQIPGEGNVLLSVTVDNQYARLVVPASANGLGWVVDGDGQVAAEETYDRRSGH